MRLRINVMNYTTITIIFSALICGTSTCHMCLSKDAIFVPGVWGPYKSAIIPDFWLNEGGQSATGALVNHIIDSHPARKECPENE